MKFHRLYLRNIKCLKGDHYIDFDSLVGGDGVFLVHGNIGTGKTAIFDAISLALYDRTPQLTGGMDPEKQNSRAYVMHHEATEAFIRFDFSLIRPSGLRQYYRAEWGIRKSKSGKFKSRRSLIILNSDFEEEKVLCADCETVKTYTPFFEAVLCGLSFEDFTRSVMLPQNAFDIFLNEDPSKRIEVLEGISDTSIVSSIIDTVKAQVDEKNAVFKSLKSTVEQLPSHISYHEAKKESAQLVKQQSSLKSLLNAVSLIREINVLNSSHDRIHQFKVRIASEMPQLEERLLNNQNQLQELERVCEEGSSALELAEQTRRARLSRLQRALDIQGQSQAKAHILTGIVAQIKKYKTDYDKQKKKLGKEHIAEDSSFERRLQSSRAQLEQTLQVKLYDSYFQAVNNRTAEMKEKSDELNQIKDLRSERLELEGKLNKYRVACDDLEHQLEQSHRTLEIKTQELESNAQLISDLNRRFELLRQSLEPFSLRDSLESGKPCMVCGSTEHPFQHSPEERAKLQAEHKALEAEMAQREAQGKELQKLIQKELTDQVRLKERLANGQVFISQVEASYLTIDSKYRGLLEKHNCKSLMDVERLFLSYDRQMGTLERLYSQFERESNAYNQYTQSRQKSLEAERVLKQLEAQWTQQEEEYERISREHAELNTQLEGVRTQLVELWSLDVDMSLDGIREWIDQTFLSAQAAVNEHKRQMSSLRASLQEQQNAMTRNRTQVEECSAEIQKIEGQLHALTDSLHTIIQEVRDADWDYLPVDCEQEQLYEAILSSELQWQNQRDDLLQRIRDGKDLIDRYEAGQATRQKMQDIRLDLEHWAQLHQCLHKPKGVKGNFREYVQALYLQRLIDAANKRMKDMAPSYSLLPLTKSNGFPHLDFLISKNLGQGLPATTLSGGERFLTSLSLALGLSGLRSVQLPIETVLIDEGFGSLDSTHVDSVIEGLEALGRGQNPLRIGVISHVEGMVERIQSATTVAELRTSESIGSLKRNDQESMTLEDFKATYGFDIDNQVDFVVSADSSDGLDSASAKELTPSVLDAQSETQPS